MARKALPGRVLYSSRNTPDTASTPTAREATCPDSRLISPKRNRATSPTSCLGKEIGRPLLKPCESTSVMIMPMPMDTTIVELMSTSSRFFMIFWNRGAEARLMATEAPTAASTARGMELPV